MSAWSRLRSFLTALVARRRLDREMEADLEFHAAERADDLVRRGMDRGAAIRRSRLELGDPLKWREEGREARGLRLLDECRGDVRYGVRWLLRSPAFAATAIASLALGIGANAAMFNLINVALLQSLPVRQPDRLVVYTMATARGPNYFFSTDMVQAFRGGSRTLEDTIASAPIRLNVDVDSRAEPTVSGQMVSGNYYRVLGVPAATGRLIEPQDEGAVRTGAVAVLSHGYWLRRFGRAPAVLGSVLRLNGIPFTIVGVSAPDFFGTHVGASADVTVPLSMQPVLMAEAGGGRVSGQGRGDFWLEVIGRLKPAVTSVQSQAEMNGIFRPLIEEFLRSPKAKVFGETTLAFEPGSRGLSELRQRFSRPLFVLMGAVVLVLVIACVNVANLFLARSASRRREMAVRVSLGAGRARLVRQLLTESVLVAVAGGAVGLALAFWTSRTLAGLLVDGSAFDLAARPDTRVLLFAMAVSLATGLIFGLAPAFGSSRVDTTTALKQGSQQLAAGSRFGVRGVLVSIQVAISVMLLVGAGLFVRTLVNLRHLDLGLDDEHVLTLRLEPAGSNQKRDNEPRLRRIYQDVLDRVARVPGVRAASLAGVTPLGNENPLLPEISILDYEPSAGLDVRIRQMQVYPGYLAAAGVPLVAGRDLTLSDDRPDAPHVAVVNATFAKRFFGAPERAIGRKFKNCIGSVCTSDVQEVVGVSGDTQDRGLREDVMPLAYGTFARTSTGRGQMTLVVRASGDPRQLMPAIRQLAHDADPTMPMFEVQTIEDRVRAASRQEALVALLSAIFGAVALALATIGLYGVLAYSVARRRPEFGVRLALGATPGGLERLVIGESCLLVVAGLAVGLGGAAVAARSIAHMLFGLAPVDAVSYALAGASLLAVAIIAAWVPARHAGHTDPIVALRQE